MDRVKSEISLKFNELLLLIKQNTKNFAMRKVSMQINQNVYIIMGRVKGEATWNITMNNADEDNNF